MGFLTSNTAAPLQPRRSPTTMAAGAFYLPKESKKRPLGEDAHFIFPEGQTIGVADGVGAWSFHGVDAGKYSRMLMSKAEASARSQAGGGVNPMKALTDAYAGTNVLGSSTACILTLTDDGVISAVNVGDSGFAIVRAGSVEYKSPVQQREFNYPFQLGRGIWSDRPAVAARIKVEVRPGDVIVMATDGLFDNVKDELVAELVGGGADAPGKVAERLAKEALKIAKSKDVETPIALEARKAGIEYSGGKYDDITVIVAYIEAAADQSGTIAVNLGT
ncbi:unnamed protein product [Cuscuta campestris]|uniref:Protein phosphatase n=1 Tax=Cuscuta campestris TaxID=132261 RepID=A0A484N3G5_9ASTE|nr:unnamed protein product [Cuscuta campestris]